MSARVGEAPPSGARRPDGRIPKSEFRPLLHAGTALVALGLGIMPRWMNLVGAGLGLLAGWVVIPMTSLEARLRRPGEPFLGGLRTYPVAVFLLVWLLPATLAATAWSVFAAGDAAASIVGRHVAAPKLFGHRKATWSGTPAFVGVGALAGIGVGAFVEATGGGPGVRWPIVIAAALSAALVDLVRIAPDDNVPNATAAGLVVAWGAGLLG